MDTRRRLYHARIDSRLTLEQIGIRTALSPTVLRHIDAGKFELLPSGVYARSYVRTFAAAVGLDPEEALAGVEHLLPGAPDPLPAMNAMRPDPAEWAGLLLRRFSGAVAALLMSGAGSLRTRVTTACVRASALGVRVQDIAAPCIAAVRHMDPRSRCVQLAGPWQRSCRPRLEAGARRLRTVGFRDLASRLREVAVKAETVAAWKRVSLRGIALPSVGRLQASPRLARCGAAAIDALLLLVVDGFLVLLVSWSSGIRFERLLLEAGWALGAFCTIPIALYFVLFGGIAGSTLGGYVCSLLAPVAERSGLASARPDHPLTLPEILRRAVRQ